MPGLCIGVNTGGTSTLLCDGKKHATKASARLVGESCRAEVDEGDPALLVHHEVPRVDVVVRHALPEQGRSNGQSLPM